MSLTSINNSSMNRGNATSVLLRLIVTAMLALGGTVQADEQPPLPEGNLSICGTCPSGYALISSSPDSAQCGEHMLAHCIPLGAPAISVCGSCPEGYHQVGSSYQPARCGNAEAGNMSQCQIQKLEGGVIGPAQGGIYCPPDCAGPLASPGTKTPPPVFCPPTCAAPGQSPPPPVYPK